MRDPEDLRTDPRFEYMVGRLVGATEMMTHYMALHGDSKAQGMAQRVNSITNFFMQENERSELPKPIPTHQYSSSEADTLIVPPLKEPNG